MLHVSGRSFAARLMAQDSGAALFRRLIWLYHLGSFAAVGVTLFLVLLGLEFTPWQWATFWVAVPIGVGRPARRTP